MFRSDPSIKELDIRKRGVTKMLFSMNIHQVATPELTAEDARCYIAFLPEGSNITAYIGLYLPRSDRRFFYSYSSNPFPGDALREVEEEARAFVEDMGFVLDEINLGSMPAGERSQWIDDQEMFTPKKRPAAPPAAAAEPAPDITPLSSPAEAPGGGQQWRPPSQAAAPSGSGQAWQPPAEPAPQPAPKRAPAPQARSVPSSVSKDKEPLARLLASF